MLIRVLCSDKSRGYVDDNSVQDLIKRGIVVAIFRPETNEWIDAGKNPSEVEKWYFGNNRANAIESEKTV
jgi:hypothetical protein